MRWALSVIMKTRSPRTATPRLMPEMASPVGTRSLVPGLAAGAGVECEALVRPGDVHDAVDDLRSVFEGAAGAGHDPHPARGELGDVGGVYFGEGAEAVAANVAVVAGPFAFDGVGDAGEVDAL